MEDFFRHQIFFLSSYTFFEWDWMWKYILINELMNLLPLCFILLQSSTFVVINIHEIFAATLQKKKPYLFILYCAIVCLLPFALARSHLCWWDNSWLVSCINIDIRNNCQVLRGLFSHYLGSNAGNIYHWWKQQQFLLWKWSHIKK